MYFINKQSLLPVCSFALDKDMSAVIYENTEVIPESEDAKFTDVLAKKFSVTSIYSNVMAFDTAANQIVLGEEALKLINTEAADKQLLN